MNSVPIQLTVARDFSRTPGPRFRKQGPFSGEEFREAKLEPAFLAARENGTHLRIDLDGTAGYATSFLEEAFGGLARLHGEDAVSSSIELVSRDEPYLVAEVQQYIKEAKAEKR